MRLRFFAAILAVFSTHLIARADQFSYDFTSGYDEFAGRADVSFSLISPTLITSESTSLPTTSCEFFGHTCYGVIVAPTGDPDYSFLPADIGFVANDGGGFTSGLFAAFPSSFFTVGTHTYGTDTLVIQDLPSSVTPEPASLILLATGALGGLAVVRRRFA